MNLMESLLSAKLGGSGGGGGSPGIDLTKLSLGIHTDGLLYIFYNGEPIGSGVSLPSGATGDVVGNVDSENNIIVTGALADGTYFVKYELEDGTTIEIGELVLDSNVNYSITNNLTNCVNSNNATSVVKGESYSATITANSGYELSSIVVIMGGVDITASAVSGGTVSVASVTGDLIITAVATEAAVEPSYTNVLPLAVDANGNSYKGTNGEAGYNTGYKISVSSGNESSADACVSGFIKLTEGAQSQIRLKNITLSSAASINNIVFYKSDKTLQKGYAGNTSGFNAAVKVTDGVYLIETNEWFTNDNTPVYFRFSCGAITDETIVTVDEEIV